MTHRQDRSRTDLRRRIAALTLASCAAALSPAGAWAHGDEPHADEPQAAATPGPARAAGKPGAAVVDGGSARFEAATEAFELVGRLDAEAGALTLYINRFETSEPVLRAKVELESGERKAQAAFLAETGGYVVREPAFVQALARPGTHPVVVTVAAGSDADLLEATLTTTSEAPATAAGEDDGDRSPVVTALAGAFGLAVLGAGAWAARRRRTRSPFSSGDSA